VLFTKYYRGDDCAGQVTEMGGTRNTRMDMILIGKYCRENITLDTDAYMRG